MNKFSVFVFTFSCTLYTDLQSRAKYSLFTCFLTVYYVFDPEDSDTKSFFIYISVSKYLLLKWLYALSFIHEFFYKVSVVWSMGQKQYNTHCHEFKLLLWYYIFLQMPELTNNILTRHSFSHTVSYINFVVFRNIRKWSDTQSTVYQKCC